MPCLLIICMEVINDHFLIPLLWIGIILGWLTRTVKSEGVFFAGMECDSSFRSSLKCLYNRFILFLQHRCSGLTSLRKGQFFCSLCRVINSSLSMKLSKKVLQTFAEHSKKHGMLLLGNWNDERGKFFSVKLFWLLMLLLSFINSKRVTLSGKSFSFIPFMRPKRSLFTRWINETIEIAFEFTLRIRAFVPIAKACRG